MTNHCHLIVQQTRPPPAPDPGGGLPNTGGPSWWLVLTALGMIVAGTATIRSAQRRPMPG